MNLQRHFTRYNTISNIQNNDTSFDENICDIIKIIKLGDYRNHSIELTNSDECSICLEYFKYEETFPIDIINMINEFEEKKTQTNNSNICVISCMHIYHKECLLDWLKKHKYCPYCRNKLNKIK